MSSFIDPGDVPDFPGKERIPFTISLEGINYTGEAVGEPLAINPFFDVRIPRIGNFQIERKETDIEDGEYIWFIHDIHTDKGIEIPKLLSNRIGEEIEDFFK